MVNGFRSMITIQNIYNILGNKISNEMQGILQGYPIRNKQIPDVDKVKDAMRRISEAFGLGWNEGQIKNYLHYTKTQGVTFISLLIRDYTYYVSMNHKGIVVADYSRIPPRYVSEWEVME